MTKPATEPTGWRLWLPELVHQLWRRSQAVAFVILTLVLWFAFAVTGQAIVASAGRIDECMQRQSVWRCVTEALTSAPTSNATSSTATAPSSSNASTTGTSTSRRRWRPDVNVDAFVLIIALLGALWAASRAVFPPEDFDRPPSRRKPEKAPAAPIVPRIATGE